LSDSLQFARLIKVGCRSRKTKNPYSLLEGVAIAVRKTDLKRLAVLGALAMEMAFSVLGGTVLGHTLDAVFGTAPALTIVFLFVGLAAGVVAFVKLWILLKEKI
jgi:F0F1-type ATP synthase assembly protein I